MNPILRIGGLDIPAYRTFTVLALIVGLATAAALLARGEVRLRTALALTAATIAGGLIGARLFAALTVTDRFWDDPSRLFALRPGDMAIYGGLAGAALTGAVAARVAGVPILRFADSSAPAAAAGIAVLRIGCLFAGCAVGKATGLSWGITYPRGSDAALLQIDGTGWSLLRSVQPVHPVPIYEIVAALLIGGIGYAILRRCARDGTATAIIVGGYSIARLLIHPIREVPLGGTPAWFDPVMYAAVAASALLWLSRPRLQGLFAGATRHLRAAWPVRV